MFGFFSAFGTHQKHRNVSFASNRFYKQPQTKSECEFIHPSSRLLMRHTRRLRSCWGHLQTPVRACVHRLHDFRRKMEGRVTSRAALCVPFTCCNTTRLEALMRSMFITVHCARLLLFLLCLFMLIFAAVIIGCHCYVLLFYKIILYRWALHIITVIYDLYTTDVTGEGH